MDKEKVRGYLNVASQAISEALKELDVPDETVDSDLQVALDKGGDITLEAKTQFTQDKGFFYKVPNTSIRGIAENVLVGGYGPAVTFPIRYKDGSLENVFLNTETNEVVCLVGKNDTTQVTVEDVPKGIKFSKVSIPAHTGKRGFEINASDVLIEDCFVYGLYDPEKQDSQAVLIMNTTGNVTVRGGQFEAAAENLMVGGDKMKIPGVRPTNILIENAYFTKPLEWKGNTAIPVKNLLELKDGHNVVIRNCKLTNCWTSAQIGWGFVLTPRQGGSVRNVLIENCEMTNVAGIVNILGVDANWPNEPRTQVVFRGGKYRTNKAEMGGTGRFAMLTGGPESVIIDGIDCVHDGNSFLGVEDKAIVDVLYILNSKWNYGQYGIRIGGYADGDNQLGIVKDIKIEGNTISGANSRFKARYPNNTYV